MVDRRIVFALTGLVTAVAGYAAARTLAHHDATIGYAWPVLYTGLGLGVVMCGLALHAWQTEDVS